VTLNPTEGEEYVDSFFHWGYLEGFLRKMLSMLQAHRFCMKLTCTDDLFPREVFNNSSFGVFLLFQPEFRGRLLVYEVY